MRNCGALWGEYRALWENIRLFEGNQGLFGQNIGLFTGKAVLFGENVGLCGRI